MPDIQALTKTLSDAVRVQLRGYEVGDVLDRLTEDAAEVLGADGAGISLAANDEPLRFVTATDEKVVRLETWIETHQEGPCQDAFHEGAHAIVEDLEAEQRRAGFRQEALASGIRCAASFPMSADGGCIGAMTLYAEQPRGWTRELVAAAQLLTDLATLYIVNQRVLNASTTLAEQLQHALDSRVIIEQAKGVIAERKGIEPTSAFGVLRAHARSNRTTVHRVAQEVVDGKLDL